MRHKFLITDNVSRLVNGLGELEERVRAGSERGLGIMEGRTGTGKTWAGEWYIVNHPQAVYVRAFETWSPAWMLRDLSVAAGLPPRFSTEANLRQLKTELSERPRLIIVDEGDYVIQRKALLETLRDLYDLAKQTPVVLVSEGGGRELVARRSPRTWRRVGQVVEFAGLTPMDVQLMGMELLELPNREIPRSEAEALLRHAAGNSFGEVMVELEKVETFAKANPGVDLKHIVAMVLHEGRPFKHSGGVKK